MLAGDVAFDKDSDVELPFVNQKKIFTNTHPKENASEVQLAPRFESDLLALKKLIG